MLAGKEHLQFGAAEYRTLRKSAVVQEGDWGRTRATSAVLPCNDARQPKTRSTRGRRQQEVTTVLRHILKYKSKSFTGRGEPIIRHLRAFPIT